jgi:Flp pilus assembly protein TadG
VFTAIINRENKLGGQATRTNARGQAAVELAIVIPILLLLVMLILYVGMFAFSKSVVLLSAHAGARQYLMVANLQLPKDEMRKRVTEVARDVLKTLPNDELADVQMMILVKNEVTVRVVYPYTFPLPLISQIVGKDGISLESEVVYHYISNEP